MLVSEKSSRERSEETPRNKKPRLITDFFQQNGPKSKPLERVEADEKAADKITEKLVSRTESIGNKTKKVSEVTVVTESVREKSSDTVTTKDSDQKVSALNTIDGMVNSQSERKDEDYRAFCAKFGFDKEEWVKSLSPEVRELLDLEIKHLHISWLVFLHKTITQPYFLKLKRFLRAQKGKLVFPPEEQIYSWSHYTPLPTIKCIVLGQDPYHNFRQAHGLAFSVLEPTRPPPSLLNIYKALNLDFPNFVTPDYNKLAREGRPGGGNLTKWAKNGVLLLNAVLTVECHKANSHASQGWEKFTEEVVRTAINFHKNQRNKGFVIMAWGTPAQNRIKLFTGQLNSNKFLVLKSVHPSPLSAHRGFFDLKVFKKCNQWLSANGHRRIDWGIVDGNVVV